MLVLVVAVLLGCCVAAVVMSDMVFGMSHSVYVLCVCVMCVGICFSPIGDLRPFYAFSDSSYGLSFSLFVLRWSVWELMSYNVVFVLVKPRWARYAIIGGRGRKVQVKTKRE